MVGAPLGGCKSLQAIANAPHGCDVVIAATGSALGALHSPPSALLQRPGRLPASPMTASRADGALAGASKPPACSAPSCRHRRRRRSLSRVLPTALQVNPGLIGAAFALPVAGVLKAAIGGRGGKPKEDTSAARCCRGPAGLKPRAPGNPVACPERRFPSAVTPVFCCRPLHHACRVDDAAADPSFVCERVCTSSRLMRRMGGLAKVGAAALLQSWAPGGRLQRAAAGVLGQQRGAVELVSRGRGVPTQTKLVAASPPGRTRRPTRA